MSDALASATASFEVIQRQLSDCVNTVEMLQRTVNSSNTMTNTTLSASVTSVMVRECHAMCLITFDLF